MKKKEFWSGLLQFVKFGFVGVFNTGLDFFIYVILTNTGLDKFLSQTISYTCGVLSSYLLNMLWTFRKEHSRTAREFLLFVCVNLVSLGVSLGMIYVAAHLFCVKGILIHILGYSFYLNEKIVQKLIATPVAMVVNFIGNKLFVFKKPEHSEK